MLKREYLASQGFNTGRGRPSRQAMDALAAYRAEHGAFSDDAPTVTITAKSGGSTAPVVVTPDKVNVDAKAVRLWAKDNNVAVGERGRIHPDVISQYLADGGATVKAADIKIANGKDLRQVAPMTSPEGSTWISVDRKYKVGPASVCVNCRVSLGWHTCANARVISKDGNGFVPMTYVEGKGIME